jgi:hypothetical protein
MSRGAAHKYVRSKSFPSVRGIPLQTESMLDPFEPYIF